MVGVSYINVVDLNLSGPGVIMPMVKVSPKFQVVIPKEVREVLKLEPGQELHMYVVDGSIHMRRPRSIKELRGMAKGMKWKDDYRDHSERF
jgi:AbrB family looped-hinge helix DNA binding protein